LTPIDYLEEITVEQMYLLTAENGFQAECSESHPIITSYLDKTGTFAEKLKAGKSNVKCFDLETMKSSISKLVRLEKTNKKKAMMISLANKESALYLIGSNRTQFIEGHNLKDPREIDGGIYRQYETPLEF